MPPDLLILSKSSIISEGLIYERKNAKAIIKEINGESFSLILGANSSGKTMLCHYFFKLLHKENFIPIYVDGSTIHSNSIDAFIRIVEKNYQEQYLSVDLDIFRQTRKEDKAIILDNLHCAHLNSKAKRVLLSLICETFKTVLSTADLTFAIEELTLDDGIEVPVIPNLKQYQISPFGHVLRSELITKWAVLGQEDKIEKGELIRLHDHFQKIINTVLGKNLVPSYPFFLIIILQRSEDDIPHDIQSSAYGYYYEYLILRALKDVKKRNEEIDAIYNYLTELANFLFEQKIRTLTQDKLISFHSWYCTEYRITPSFSDTINSLLEAQILIERYHRYGFRYPYVYYFFVANYLSNNMTKKNIRERISKMCMRLYQQEFTNIIMFLTHLSKDPFTLDRVLYSAKSIFRDESPQYFDEPIIEINNLLDSIPDTVLGSLNVEEERKKKLELEDKANPPNIEASESLPECDYDLESEIKDPESVEHFIMSLLTIQILGQILKNYYGSLKGDIKLQLGEEAYLIALRAINRFYKKLILSKEHLINIITQSLIDLGVQNKKSAKRLSQEILFTFCRFIPKIFFEQISKSLAYDNLIETFNDIKSKNNSVAFGLIDVTVRMDCQKSFPLKESGDLLKSIKDDTLPNLMLKDLVLNHLYLFPRKRAEVQSICDKLGISRKIAKSITLK